MKLDHVRYILSQIEIGADGKYCQIQLKSAPVLISGMVWEPDCTPINLIQIDSGDTSYYLDIEDIALISIGLPK